MLRLARLVASCVLVLAGSSALARPVVPQVRAVTVPEGVPAPASLIRGTSQGAPSPEQDPCLTQLNQDLKECIREFCPNLLNCSKEAYRACIRGAEAAFDDCRNEP